MFRRTMTAAAIAMLALVATETGPHPLGVAQAACATGERIDGSTASDAKKKMEQAGYRQVRDLRKGCDNVWHASAMKDGGSVLIAIAPNGTVVPEGN